MDDDHGPETAPTAATAPDSKDGSVAAGPHADDDRRSRSLLVVRTGAVLLAVAAIGTLLCAAGRTREFAGSPPLPSPWGGERGGPLRSRIGTSGGGGGGGYPAKAPNWAEHTPGRHLEDSGLPASRSLQEEVGTKKKKGKKKGKKKKGGGNGVKQRGSGGGGGTPGGGRSPGQNQQQEQQQQRNKAGGGGVDGPPDGVGPPVGDEVGEVVQQQEAHVEKDREEAPPEQQEPKQQQPEQEEEPIAEELMPELGAEEEVQPERPEDDEDGQPPDVEQRPEEPPEQPETAAELGLDLNEVEESEEQQEQPRPGEQEEPESETEPRPEIEQQEQPKAGTAELGLDLTEVEESEVEEEQQEEQKEQEEQVELYRPPYDPRQHQKDKAEAAAAAAAKQQPQLPGQQPKKKKTKTKTGGEHPPPPYPPPEEEEDEESPQRPNPPPPERPAWEPLPHLEDLTTEMESTAAEEETFALQAQAEEFVTQIQSMEAEMEDEQEQDEYEALKEVEAKCAVRPETLDFTPGATKQFAHLHHMKTGGTSVNGLIRCGLDRMRRGHEEDADDEVQGEAGGGTGPKSAAAKKKKKKKGKANLLPYYSLEECSPTRYARCTDLNDDAGRECRESIDSAAVMQYCAPLAAVEKFGWTPTDQDGGGGGGQTDLVSVVRHPVDRVWSMFRFRTKSCFGCTPLIDIYEAMDRDDGSVDELCGKGGCSKECLSQLVNHQTRNLLTDTFDEDDGGDGGKDDGGGGEGKAGAGSTVTVEEEEEKLSEALDNLRTRIALVGITDELPVFAEMLGRVFPWLGRTVGGEVEEGGADDGGDGGGKGNGDDVCELPHANASPKNNRCGEDGGHWDLPDEPDEETARIILDHNWMDLRVYEEARERFELQKQVLGL